MSGNPTTTDDPAARLRAEGKPAFPGSIHGCGDNGWHGMSLRDWFAGQALVAALGREFGGPGEYAARVAKGAYQVADAMLVAREAINGR